ncbi:hypothetical protein T4B_15071 [Trichinella pseudospiralis]|uniref:Uncharacterized protein n=1 Tax=Trichinella pseudospiralis TaxID=6337 RepID=A0A0V1IIQ8_TRIPS|nr:hypothetical protein T4B_15071 [Trichinella pseudospiralis]
MKNQYWPPVLAPLSVAVPCPSWGYCYLSINSAGSSFAFTGTHSGLLHPFCGIFLPFFLSNHGQRSRRSPKVCCHSIPKFDMSSVLRKLVRTDKILYVENQVRHDRKIALLMVDNVNQVIGVINTANVGQTIWLTESNRPDPIRSDPIRSDCTVHLHCGTQSTSADGAIRKMAVSRKALSPIWSCSDRMCQSGAARASGSAFMIINWTNQLALAAIHWLTSSYY